ncbi:MAG: ATP cone domain-containing protein [bacterium]|nr:ATP cone domain-containing protein [bacterium]
MAIRVAKSDGTVEAFNSHKLVSSLTRSGAKQDVAEHIASEVAKGLYEGITTHEIYARAFSHLRHEKRGTAARYSLKRAVLQFGPSGFPFEEYIAQLYTAEGYEVSVDQMIAGKCVEHEVDVVIKKEATIIYAEAKFHNTPGFKCDLTVVLYVNARIDDIGEKGLVVTNTKFTDKAVQFAECAGLELLGWDYPHGESLHNRIDRAKLYPVTALTTLSRREKTALLTDRVVLCQGLSNRGDTLLRAGITGKKADAVLEEAAALCVPGYDI